MELRPIDRTDRAVGRLQKALSIYRETILAEAQNPERQILYWIDHSRDNLVDQFRCFALLDEDEVVGYLQYSYFGEEHLFFFEYLCIQDGRRSGLQPSTALERIEQYLSDNYRTGFTIVFEIAQKHDSGKQWKPDIKLIRYFKRLGFRTVEFDYHYPILQSYDGATSYPADLMVRLPQARKTVSSTEMRTILRCIYFKHYLRWDRPFLDGNRFAERERLINELYSREVARIGGQDGFGTDGADNRSLLRRFMPRPPQIRSLLRKLFAPKFPRILTTLVSVIVLQWIVGGVLPAILLGLLAAALYCLAEDTDTSRKLFMLVLSKLTVAGRRMS
jgi:hypothetical protein